MTERQGGCSLPPWDSWNLGDHVGDRSEHVFRNRETLAQRTRVAHVYWQQVHGTQVQKLHSDTVSGGVADGVWTPEAGVACTMLVADCLPVLVSDAEGTAVAALHAGWRGLAGQAGHGVLEALVCHGGGWGSLPQRRQAVVWLGPCIGPAAFEVGPEVREAFVRVDPVDSRCFAPLATSGGLKFQADLSGLARLRLQRLGFERIYGNDGTLPWCTYSNPSRFFSHRRDHALLGSSGRMAACIWRLNH